jgi:hypothetical protein
MLSAITGSAVRHRWNTQLCARRLQQGHFMRPSTHRGERFELSMSQLQAFAVGLPWERLDEHAKISIL